MKEKDGNNFKIKMLIKIMCLSRDLKHKQN